MKFGSWLPASGPSANADGLSKIARRTDELGFAFLRTSDHLVLPKAMRTSYPFGDGRIDFSNGLNDLFSAMTFAAAQTEHIELNVGCTVIALRNPFSVAQQIATMDQLSGGRTRLEVGVGWLKDEYDILRVPWEERGAMTDEYLQILRVLWETHGPFVGRYYSFPEVWSRPRPLRQPLPIYIAGSVIEPVLRRVARFGQGWTPAISSFEEVAAAIPRLRELMHEEGRDDEVLDIQYRINDVYADSSDRHQLRDRVAELTAGGITSVCVNFASMMLNPNLDEILRSAEWFADAVIDS